MYNLATGIQAKKKGETVSDKRRRQKNVAVYKERPTRATNRAMVSILDYTHTILMDVYTMGLRAIFS